MSSEAIYEPRIREADFVKLQKLIESTCGIWVSNSSLLVQRLSRRLRELQLDSFAPYCSRVLEDAEEREHMLECICTHETRFFREPQQFRFLEDELCPQWLMQAEHGKRARSLRIWSAGCATGEEPYSLAMVLRTRLPGWQLEIVASDLSEAVLEQARSGTWPIARAEDIPEPHLRRYMLQGTGSLHGRMRAAPELSACVRVLRINLQDPRYPLEGTFDAIFCRNVLIYFRDEARARVIERLVRHLGPEGHLFLGHAEGLGTHTHGVRAVGPIVYRAPPREPS